MAKIRLTSFRIIFLLIVTVSCSFASPLEIAYIGNAGVLIRSGDNKILVDAHHYNGNPVYQPVPLNVREKMIGGFKPFDGVSIILTTHLHADHFDAETVGRHLLNNPKIVFIAPHQVTNDLEGYQAYDKVSKQVKTETPVHGQTIDLSFGNVKIKMLGMKHSSKKFNSIQNIGYLIEIKDFKILHIGDADGNVEDFERFNLPNEGIDLAFVPYWFLTYKPFNKIVNEYINPGRIFALHIPPAEIEKITEEIQAGYPNAVILTTPMSSYEF